MTEFVVYFQPPDATLRIQQPVHRDRDRHRHRLLRRAATPAEPGNLVAALRLQKRIERVVADQRPALGGRIQLRVAIVDPGGSAGREHVGKGQALEARQSRHLLLRRRVPVHAGRLQLGQQQFADAVAAMTDDGRVLLVVREERPRAPEPDLEHAPVDELLREQPARGSTLRQVRPRCVTGAERSVQAFAEGPAALLEDVVRGQRAAARVPGRRQAKAAFLQERFEQLLVAGVRMRERLVGPPATLPKALDLRRQLRNVASRPSTRHWIHRMHAGVAPAVLHLHGEVAQVEVRGPRRWPAPSAGPRRSG